MRTSMLIFSIVFASGTLASAQTSWVLEQSDQMHGWTAPVPQLNVSLNHAFTEHVGAWGYAQIFTDHAQMYAGISAAPAPWLEFGIAVGMEQPANSNLRFGSFLSLSQNGLGYVYGMYENGGSGPWYRVEFGLEVTPRFLFGGIIQSGQGIGPRFEIALPWIPVQLWGGPTFDWTDTTGKPWGAIFGIRAKFKH
ncbi:MAG TPA: hypothetical protein VFQ60_03490 [Patescibacteria group bacterium]|nr:hypothetical protein [Patescibacteria group bacterium]